MSDQKDTGIGGAVKQIIDLAKSWTPQLDVGQNFGVILPPGYTRADITDAVEKAAATPYRAKGHATFKAVESFNTYVGRHFVEHASWLYADYDEFRVTAVFNDHPVDSAGWKDFRATFQAERSRELHTWIASNKKTMDQVTFAEFIEANIADVLEPGGTTLLDVALTLTASTSIEFASAKRLDNGQTQLVYKETVDAKAGSGSIEIPREFVIGIPLFKHGDPYRLTARLKYRLYSGSVKFWYEIDQLENKVEIVFRDYVGQIVTGVGQPVLTGKP